ncbi:MAG: carbon monoxide dehydrogenase subunit G, partial [Kocuria sp.]|nr:carbon monoxide dehydrogenase subunit G [Kocuria sp.]
MLISSTATMTADPATAYAAFHDEKILAATIPGVESFTRTGDSAFDVVLTMGVAAIKGTYKGTVSFSDEVQDTSFVLSAKGAGGPGTIGADITVVLAPGVDGGSDITWEADAVLGGPIGGVGQRMLGGVAKRIAKKFFGDIDAAIRDGIPDKAETGTGANRSGTVGGS